MNPATWLDIPPVLERHGEITVLRDDLLEGGTKLRFLPFLCQGAGHVVYSGPFCGGAPLALSVYGKEAGVRVSLFYAARNALKPRQAKAKANGADLHLVPNGYTTVVQKRARDFADESGALFLPLGFDLPIVRDPFSGFIASVRRIVGDPPEVWCATGSGMLARWLGEGFPNSAVFGVAVGLPSRHTNQTYPPNVTLITPVLRFEQRAKAKPPFPACSHYEAKAWELCAARGAQALFWNVMGDDYGD